MHASVLVSCYLSSLGEPKVVFKFSRVPAFEVSGEAFGSSLGALSFPSAGGTVLYRNAIAIFGLGDFDKRH